MDITTAMKHHKMEVNINTTIEVPLETMLAVRADDGRTVGLGSAISAALRSAAIDAVQAHRGSVGDTLSSPPISTADLREVDRAASEDAATNIEEMEEMMRKSLLEGKRRLKRWYPDTSMTLSGKSDTQPAPAADAMTVFHTDVESDCIAPDAITAFHTNVGLDRIETPIEKAGATNPISPSAATGNVVNVRVGYKNLRMTRQFWGTSTMNDIVADIRASLPKVPDHYRRLIWFADSRPGTEGIVLRGTTKLCNTDISRYGTVHLQSGECRTAGPREGPAPEEREIRINVMVYNEHDGTTEPDDSWVDGHGIVHAGPEMIKAQKARAQDTQLHSVFTVINMRPTNTMRDVRKAFQRLELFGLGLYMSFEDRIAGRQADDEMTLEEAGVYDGVKIYLT